MGLQGTEVSGCGFKVQRCLGEASRYRGVWVWLQGTEVSGCGFKVQRCLGGALRYRGVWVWLQGTESSGYGFEVQSCLSPIGTVQTMISSDLNHHHWGLKYE